MASPTPASVYLQPSALKPKLCVPCGHAATAVRRSDMFTVGMVGFGTLFRPRQCSLALRLPSEAILSEHVRHFNLSAVWYLRGRCKVCSPHDGRPHCQPGMDILEPALLLFQKDARLQGIPLEPAKPQTLKAPCWSQQYSMWTSFLAVLSLGSDCIIWLAESLGLLEDHLVSPPQQGPFTQLGHLRTSQADELADLSLAAELPQHSQRQIGSFRPCPCTSSRGGCCRHQLCWPAAQAAQLCRLQGPEDPLGCFSCGTVRHGTKLLPDDLCTVDDTEEVCRLYSKARSIPKRRTGRLQLIRWWHCRWGPGAGRISHQVL